MGSGPGERVPFFRPPKVAVVSMERVNESTSEPSGARFAREIAPGFLGTVKALYPALVGYAVGSSVDSHPRKTNPVPGNTCSKPGWMKLSKGRSQEIAAAAFLIP